MTALTELLQDFEKTYTRKDGRPVTIDEAMRVAANFIEVGRKAAAYDQRTQNEVAEICARREMETRLRRIEIKQERERASNKLD